MDDLARTIPSEWGGEVEVKIHSEDGVEGRVGIQLNLFPYQDIYQDAGAMVYMVVEKEVRGSVWKVDGGMWKPGYLMGCISSVVVGGAGGDGVVCVLDDNDPPKLKGVYEGYGWKAIGSMEGSDAMGRKAGGNWGGVPARFNDDKEAKTR